MCVWGGGVSRYLVEGGGGSKSLPPAFWPQQGVQPTASTIALWWLKFGPTGDFNTGATRGGGGGIW